MTPILKIGRGCVDLLNPDPGTIDLVQIERNLWTTRRFTNNPRALVVRQHTELAKILAIRANEPQEIVYWCEHHDDHEGIIGDIPGPLKTWINWRMANDAMPTVDDMEYGLDRAICSARGHSYPDGSFRKITHHYDKLAETLEWLFVLNFPAEPWNKPYENWISTSEARGLVNICAGLLPPDGLIG